MHRVYLEEAKMPPLTAPKVEHATKKGISQRKEEPNSLLANVCNKKYLKSSYKSFKRGESAMTIKTTKSTHHSNSIGGQELSGSEDGEVSNVGEHVDPRDQRQGDVDRSGQVLVWTLNIKLQLSA